MREIREEERVRRAVNDAEDRWERGFDSWEAITWTVARDPQVGRKMTEDGSVRSAIFDGARSAKMPSVEIIYRFDDEKIMVLGACRPIGAT